ncbi:MAG: hypothetical protein AAFR14_00890 [Bacteroidota bacterium]
MSTLIQPLVPRMEYGLRLTIRRIPYSLGFLVVLLLNTLRPSDLEAQSLSCYSQINLSLNASGQALLKPNQLTRRKNLDHLVVEIPGRSQPMLTCADTDAAVMVSLRDTVSGLVCMNEVIVEDKLPILLTAKDTALSCVNLLDSLSPNDLITVQSTCTTIADFQIVPSFGPREMLSSASGDTIGFINVEWRLIEQNRVSQTVNSTVFLLALDVSTLMIPPDDTIGFHEDPRDNSFISTLIGFSPGLQNACQVDIARTVRDPITFECGTKIKHIVDWDIMSWPMATVLQGTQTLYQIDSTARIIAPDSLPRIQTADCQQYIVLSAPQLQGMSPFLDVDDVEVLIEGDAKSPGLSVRAIGDTVHYEVGQHRIVYRGKARCLDALRSDTTLVEIVPTGSPSIRCGSSLNRTFGIAQSDTSVTVVLDSVYSSLISMSCQDVSILGMKTISSCSTDVGVFSNTITFCIADSKIKVPVLIKAVSPTGQESDTCTVWFDIQEKVAPEVSLEDNIRVQLDTSGILTIDTAVIFAALGDNSGCISNLLVTGSGIGMTNSGSPMTGSLSWFTDGMFQQFTCADTGSYVIEAVVTDPSSNSSRDTSRLTVLPSAACSGARMSGQVLAYGREPLAGVDITIVQDRDAYLRSTGADGTYNIPELRPDQPFELEIAYADVWRAGITTHDLAIANKYILGLESLDRYQMESADVDGSNSVTVKDLILLQKILYGQDVANGLPKTGPWVFSEANLPTLSPYKPRQWQIATSARVDWDCVKRGDLDGDIVTKSKSRSQEQWLVNQSVDRIDGRYHYSIVIPSQQELSAFQLSLPLLSEDQLQVRSSAEIDVVSNEKSIDVFYYDEIPESDNELTLEIISSNPIPSTYWTKRSTSKRWDQSGEVAQLRLTPVPFQSSDEINLHVSPNPTSDWITISLQDLRGSSPVHITISDPIGRLVSTLSFLPSEFGGAIQREVQLPGESGVYTILIQTADNQLSRRIVKI